MLHRCGATLARRPKRPARRKPSSRSIKDPTIPLINEFMRSEKTDVILATGGTAMVRAAYSSSNPAIGVGPGNAPVLVDDTADLDAAARHIVASKAFDNSVLCTNESVLITLDERCRQAQTRTAKAGAHICTEDETDALRATCSTSAVSMWRRSGATPSWIAEQAGFKVPKSVKVLVTPIDLIGVGEDLSREKLCPVLGFYVATGVQQAIMQARALLRLSGAGHSAAIHSTTHRQSWTIPPRSKSYRVVVNAPCSQGAAGLRHQPRTHLHHRHRVFRPLVGGREYRPAAPRQLDPRRLAQASTTAVVRSTLPPAPSGPSAQGARRRCAGRDPAEAHCDRWLPRTICASRSARSSPKNCARC